MKRFVLILLFWGLLPFLAIGQNAPTARVIQVPQKFYTIEQVPNVQLEKEKRNQTLQMTISENRRKKIVL